LLFFQQGRRYGVEVKFSEAPSITRSMQTVLPELGLEHLWVIHPGPHTYPVHEKITVLSVHNLITLGEHWPSA